MKKSAIFLTLLLLGSLAGTYAVYELYVKQRMRQLGEHLEEEKQLQAKIEKLEETFFKTKPDTVLRIWRAEIQPWADAVAQRAAFFNMGQIPLEVEIPEEEREIAKFYYKKIYPKMVLELETKLYESNIRLPDPTFGIPHPDTYGTGSNPPPQLIARHLARFEFGKAVAELLIDARVRRIDVLLLWPEQEELSGRSGDVKSRSTGLSFTIAMRDWVNFFDKLSQEDRYFEVKSLLVTNTTLRNPNADINVQMVLAQAYYEEDKKDREITVAGESPKMQGIFANIFGSSSADQQNQRRTSTRKSWWQQFRQRFLPF